MCFLFLFVCFFRSTLCFIDAKKRGVGLLWRGVCSCRLQLSDAKRGEVGYVLSWCCSSGLQFFDA